MKQELINEISKEIAESDLSINDIMQLKVTMMNRIKEIEVDNQKNKEKEKIAQSIIDYIKKYNSLTINFADSSHDTLAEATFDIENNLIRYEINEYWSDDITFTSNKPILQ